MNEPLSMTVKDRQGRECIIADFETVEEARQFWTVIAAGRGANLASFEVRDIDSGSSVYKGNYTTDEC